MRILYFAIILLAASCGSSENSKEAIVERQKAITTERQRIMDSAAAAITKGTALPADQSFEVDVNMNKRINTLQKEYDSLETELKKY